MEKKTWSNTFNIDEYSKAYDRIRWINTKQTEMKLIPIKNGATGILHGEELKKLTEEVKENPWDFN